MKDNSIYLLIAAAVIGIIIGISVGRVREGVDSKKQLKENEKLRKELQNKEIELIEVRRGLAIERRGYRKLIERSALRYDSLEKAKQIEDWNYRREIGRLKGKTLKQLEDEAERIYREHSNKQ
jgi:hypothetical protein